MRHDRLWLSDIVQAAAEIDSFLNGRSKAEFLASSLVRSGVLQQLTIIGEAASKVTKDLRDRHPHVSWISIIGFRNRAVHAYFSIDWEIVWTTATARVPALAHQIATILEREFPAEQSSR